MSTFRDRLAEAMAGPPKVSQAALARACGISAPSVHDWLTGKTQKIEGENLIKASAFLRVSPHWLATGKGAMRDGKPAPVDPVELSRPSEKDQDRLMNAIADLHEIQGKIIAGKLTDEVVDLVKELRAAIAGKRKKAEPAPVSEASNVVTIRPAEPEEAADFNPDEHELIRQSTARIAAGHGEQNTHVDIDRELAFKKTWIKRKRLTPSNLIVAYAWGSSMHPTIEDGDAVLIDTSSKILKNGCIYAFKDGEHEDIIKRAVKEKGAWLLRSDNPDKSVPEYQDMPFVDESGQQRFEVVGLAHWRGGDL